MSDAIIVALITGGLSLIGIIITSVRSNQQLFAKLDKQSELSDAKLDKEIAVIKTEISTLSEEVRKHNAFGMEFEVLPLAVAGHVVKTTAAKIIKKKK
jgi:hypothetical protein